LGSHPRESANAQLVLARAENVLTIPVEALSSLGEWAENYPPTFADQHSLVMAEIAMQLYEQAIHSAHENGFV